jgi:hypothetical protein
MVASTASTHRSNAIARAIAATSQRNYKIRIAENE